MSGNFSIMITVMRLNQIKKKQFLDNQRLFHYQQILFSYYDTAPTFYPDETTPVILSLH